MMNCGFPGCTRPHYAKGLCGTHYAQQLRGIELKPIREWYSHKTPCAFGGCDRRPVARIEDGRALCGAHYGQFKAGVDLHTPRDIKRQNPIIVDGDRAWLIVRDRRAQEVARTQIDAADIDMVKGIRWRRTHGGRSAVPYVTSHRVGLLHRFLMDCPDEMEVDHISSDTLDNRRSNLRIVTHAQNAQNVAQAGRADMRGVSVRADGQIMAYVTTGKRMRFRCGLGSVDDAREVARRLRAAVFTHVNESRHR